MIAAASKAWLAGIDGCPGGWLIVLVQPDGDACDARSLYLIEWHNRPELDGDSIPVSGACERHALDVDRRQVKRMSTHPQAIPEAS